MSLTDRNIAIKNLWYVIRQIQLRLIRKYGYEWFQNLRDNSRVSKFHDELDGVDLSEFTK